jgi:hypothetical protein
MYGIWNGVKFLLDDDGKTFSGAKEYAEDQMNQLISSGAANLEVRPILPDLSDIFPKRSQCHCSCHSGGGVVHCVPCCTPD